MKKSVIAGMVLFAAALAGCKRIDDATPPEAAADPVLVKSSIAFPPCSSPRPDTLGTITIIVPRNFNDNRIARSVSMKRERNFDPGNPDITIAPADINTPGTAIVSRKIQPFDAYIDGTRPNSVFKPGDTGLVLVRVAIPNGSDWEFHSADGKFHGVSLAKEEFASMTCGGSEETFAPSTLTTRAKQVATFYFDIERFFKEGDGFAIPFNIALILDDYDETPIIIDPKIRNDGACCRAQTDQPDG